MLGYCHELPHETELMCALRRGLVLVRCATPEAKSIDVPLLTQTLQALAIATDKPHWYACHLVPRPVGTHYFASSHCVAPPGTWAFFLQAPRRCKGTTMSFVD